MAHIVVAIPAVEDADLPETLRHLYALSSRQHELTVVVHEQCSEHGQLAVDEMPYFDADWHQYIYVHGDEARGCWPARRHISSHLQERDITGDYGMVIDSHTRFRANWDSDLISLHSRARQIAWLGQTTNDAVLTGLMHPQLWGDSWNRIPVTLYKKADWTLGGFMPLGLHE